MAYGGSIASLAVDIRADLGQLRSDFASASRVSQSAMADLRSGVTKELQTMEASARTAGRAILSSLGSIGAVEITKRLAEVSDGFQNVQAKIRLVTNSQQEFARTSRDVFDIAQKTYTSYDAVATLVGRTARALESLGSNNEQALKDSKGLAEVVSEGLAISGATASEASASVIQLTQALASNKLAGDEFRSFMENAPRLSTAVATALGITIGELRQLSKEGKLNTEIVTKALLSQKAVLENEYANVPLTVGRAWQQLSNQFTVFIGQGAEVSGAARGLANSLIYVGEHLKEVSQIIAAGGVVLLARQISSVVDATARWVMTQQANAAFMQATAIEAARNAQVAHASAVATLESAEAKLAEARASSVQLQATAAVVVAAREEQIIKLRGLEVEAAQAAAVLAAAQARGAQSAAIAVAIEAEASLMAIEINRMAVVNELAALGVNAARINEAQAVSAASLAAAETAVAEAQTAAAAASTRLAAAQAGATGAASAAAVGVGGLGRGLLAFVGGPVGLTIAGVAALAYGMYALSESADTAEKAADELIAQFNKAAAAARNFSTNPLHIIDKTSTEVELALLKDYNQAVKDLEDLKAQSTGNFGEGALGGDVAAQEDRVARLRDKLYELRSATYEATEAEVYRQGQMGKGNALADEARRLLAEQTGGLDSNTKSVKTNAKAMEASQKFLDDYADKYAKWVEQTTKGFESVRNSVDPMAKLNEEFEEQKAQLAEAAALWEGQPAKLAEVARVLELVTAQYTKNRVAAQQLLNPQKKALKDVSSQIEEQRDRIMGLSQAQTQYNRSVREAEALAADRIADGKDEVEVNRELIALKKQLGILRDTTIAADFISQFENVGGGFDELVKKIEDAEAALRNLGDTGDEVMREKLLRSIENAKSTLTSGLINTTQEGLRGIQTLTQQGSKEFAILEVAIQGLAFANAVSAILAQGALPPPAGFAAMAAMAAAVAPLLASIGAAAAAFGGGGGPSHQSAEYRQEHQGTGSILGDLNAKSESMAHALDITANATSELVGLNRGMLNALKAMQNALGAAGNQIARGAADVDHAGLHNTTYGSLGPMGDYLDPLTNALTGAYDPVGQAVGSFLWGGKQKVIDEGIVIVGGTIQSMLDDIMVGAYQTVHTSGGLFGSGSDHDDIADISDTFGKQFQLVIKSIADTVRAGAEALGLLPADVQKAIEDFQVEEIRISLKGLSAEDQQKELEAVFSKLFDDLAGAVVPFIADFQQVGEGLGETLVRVATEVQVTQEAFRQLGRTASTTDPEAFAHIADSLVQAVGGIDAFIQGLNNFVEHFASDGMKFQSDADALNTAFNDVGLSLPSTRDGMWELMQSLDDSTEAGREQIATLLRLADAADKYYKALDDAREFLEGLEIPGLSAASSDFRRQIANIREQAAKAVDALNLLARAEGRSGASAQDLAAVHRWAADQARKAIAALRASAADIISQLYGGTPGTLDEINRRIQELEANQISGIDEVGNAAENMYQRQLDAIKQISDFLDDLMLGDLTTLTPEQQLMEAQRQYESLLARAQAGDADALAALPEAARAYLEQARSFYSATDGYTQIFDDVTSALHDIVDAGPTAPNTGTNPGGTGNPATTAELAELYAQRDAMQAQQAAADRLALAQTLAQQLRDLSDALGIPIFTLAEQMGVSMEQFVADLGVDLSAITSETGGQLAGIAAMLGVTVPELTGQLGVSMSELVTAMGLNLDDLSMNTATSIAAVASTLGLTVPELTTALGLSMHDLVMALGVNLDTLTSDTVVAMAGVAHDMGISLTELARSVGIDLGELADSQSLLNDGLESVIDTLPAGTRDALRQLLENVEHATTEADANEAIEALREATMDLPEDQRDLLEPFFDEIDPTEQLDDLDWLHDISVTADSQLVVLTDIRTQLIRLNAISGVGVTNQVAATSAAAAAATDSMAAASAATYGVTDAGATQTAAMIAAIESLKECIEDSDEQTRASMEDRLSALESAVKGGGNVVASTLDKAVRSRSGLWGK